MRAAMKAAADHSLAQAVANAPHLPGVVAAVSDGEGLLYHGAAGLRRLGGGEPMRLDTVLAMFSCTKAVTAVAALQLLEEGRLELDAPAKAHLPEIAHLRVLTGFDGDGQPVTRAPLREITVRHLFTHTSGLGYDFTNADVLRLARTRPSPGPRNGRRSVLDAALTFDPGAEWQYGLSMDWLGLVVEAVAGRPLAAVMQERVFEPLGMRDTGFRPTADMAARRASLHRRGQDGALQALDFPPPQAPEDDLGGSGLYSTAEDYLRFLRMILNDGQGPNGRVLRPETVALAARNALPPGIDIKLPKSVLPALSNDFDLFPHLRKSWGLSFLINEEALPTGRPEGSLSWAGLANLYYWIDRKNRIAGFWATQLFPFVDIAAWPAAQAFEAAVYRGLRA